MARPRLGARPALIPRFLPHAPTATRRLTAIDVHLIGATSDWHNVAHFFTTLTVEGLTGLLAALAVVLLAGGYTTRRRVTV